MGTMIQNLDLTDAHFGGGEYRMLSDLLVFSRPEDIRDIHLEYFKSGSNGVETNTFGASPLRLSEYDFSNLDTSCFPDLGFPDLKTLNYDELAYHMSKQGASLAKEAKELFLKSEDYDGRPLFVIGSIGPSNWVLSSTAADLRRATWEQIVDCFYHQGLGLIDGGADVFLHETQQDILELKAAVFGSLKAMKERNVRLPIIAQVTVDNFSKMQIFNTDIHAALVTMQGIGVDVFGINCSIGPELMEKTVKTLSEFSQIPISVLPNAGMPVSEDGQTVFKLEPDQLASYIAKFTGEYGVNVVGGCCGTTPAHIRAIAKAIKPIKVKKREITKKVYLSGPQNAIEINSNDGLVRIGERLNVRGSKKVRDAVENEEGIIDHEVLEEVIVEQVKDLGVEIIDVCMDSNLVKTEEVLPEVVYKQTIDFPAAMCLDAFDAEVLNEVIKFYPGRPIINSISMEDYTEGVSKVDAVCPLTAPHNPVYIGLCTSPIGPAQTAKEKEEIARQIVKATAVYGVTPAQLIIDVNVFPIGSESSESINFAVETLESLPLVKAIHPDIKTSFGVGNLTNGLAKKPYMRKVLTSVFIDEGRKRGLDAAIINPHHYVPVESIDKNDYEICKKILFDRDMDAFAELEEIAERKTGKISAKRSNYDDLELYDKICQKIVDGYKERIAGTLEVKGITYEYSDKIVLDAAETIGKIEPLTFINDYLMSAMKTLGDGFAAGDVSLPHLLKSADVMKQVMNLFEEYMKRESGEEISDKITYKGTIILGTVYQDVHSIGKDLTKTLLENYGYRVIDLGVQVKLQEFIDKAKEYNADAIGMSALLVQTSNHMITVSKMLSDAGMDDVNILIGGAPVNNRHAGYVAMYGQPEIEKIKSNVFYCSSGMEGVKNMDMLMSQKSEEHIEKNAKILVDYYERSQKTASKQKGLLESLPRREIKDYIINSSVKCVAGEVIKESLVSFEQHINKKNLFSLNWHFGGTQSKKRKNLGEDELDNLVSEWIERCAEDKSLEPCAIYGIFPCNSEGNDLVIFDPKDETKELDRFDFNLCIGHDKKDTFSAAQYYLPMSSGKRDICALQISSGGTMVDERVQKYKDADDSESALFLQGLSDRIAEDMADFSHQYIRNEVGATDKQGTRYSPGYDAIKDVHHNRKIMQLLDAENKLGIKTTEVGEFYPTGTTGAIICFHPEASYG